MGTIYTVACRDCKLARNLDKLDELSLSVKSRQDALEISKAVERNSFRVTLLLSFLWEHKGHNCTVFSEHDDPLSEELDPDRGNTQEDADWWHDEPEFPDNPKRPYLAHAETHQAKKNIIPFRVLAWQNHDHLKSTPLWVLGHFLAVGDKLQRPLLNGTIQTLQDGQWVLLADNTALVLDNDEFQKLYTPISK